jgi:hypothetical protein
MTLARSVGRSIVDFNSRAMPLAELVRAWLTLRYPLTDPYPFDILLKRPWPEGIECNSIN